MENRPHQPIRIPAYLTTGEPGSFAAFTIEKRLPVILANLATHADVPAGQALHRLAAEIPEGRITSLPSAVFDKLNRFIEPYIGRQWQDMPFLTVELYFYARILLAFGYTAATPIDPFQSIKNTANTQAVESLATITGYCDADNNLTEMLRWSMMGNTADLSQQVVPHADQISLLVDESHVVGGLLDSGLHRIDYVFDNAGMDILADLLLIRRICERCPQIVAHVRPYPMFVSDVTMADLEYLIEKLTASLIPSACKLGENIVHLLHSNRLILRNSPALGLPVCFCEDEALTHDTFENADLVIFKGDLNYRYFIGDRRWPHTTGKNFFSDRFGRSAVTLRTLKSEVLVGLPPETAAKTSQFEQGWLTNGHYGIIQAFTGINE
jgi:uncharacterized protein with ATP-grasp and redox domains